MEIPVRYAKKTVLEYPTGISVNPTGARKCCLTQGGVRGLSCMTSDDDFDVFTSFLTY